MDLNNRRHARLFTAIVIIATIVLVAIGLRFGKRQRISNKKLDLNFKGVVEKVHYDYQGAPQITVNNKKYDLFGTIRNLDYRIQKGDTIIKQKGDLRIKIIKPNSRDTIYDRNPLYNKGY